MKPYPNNNIKFKPITPVYIQNQNANGKSRYSVYGVIDNLPYKALEVKLSNAISSNPTYKGYYYTTTKNTTLYEIAKKYYEDESLYWVIAKANNIKDNGLSTIPKGITIIVPNIVELQTSGGYFTTRSNIGRG